MTRRLAILLAAAGLLAHAPAAGAAVGGPYALASPLAGNLVVAPVAPGGTLVVQADLAPEGVVLTPAAVTSPPLPVGCSNATLPGRTVCDPALVASSLTFRGGVVEARATRISTPRLNFDGGVANDLLVVSGPGTIGTLNLDPGAGADSMSIGGDVATIGLAAADPGDDRYDIHASGLAPQTLALGAGADVAANISSNVTLDGGAGNDTLSGFGPLRGGDGDDLLEPQAVAQAVDGGAGTDRLSFDLIATPLDLVKSGTDVAAGGVAKTGIERLEGGSGNDTMRGGPGPDVLLGGDGDDVIAGGGGGDTLDGGPGSNTVSYADALVPVTVDLEAGTATAGTLDRLSSFRTVVTGAGDDTVTGSPADERFDLGAGNDRVDAGPGDDRIVAGPGNDLVRGGHGTDDVDGGAGEDTATYDERTASEPVSVTLATPGDEGADGENDTLAGVEDVVGGASSDVLSGNDEANVLIAGGGLNTLAGPGGDDTLVGGDLRDVISGGPGHDTLLGGGDDDSIDAFDGEADLVDCGPSVDDDAQVDATDTVSGCEFSRRGDVPVPVDADGDGTVAGFDCDDANPAIGLTATDIPGDGVDQNCDGFDAQPAIVASALRVKFATPTARGTRFTQFGVAELQEGSTVVATCRTAVKARCPFARATRRPARAGAEVTFLALLRRRVLPAGTTLELRITAPGTIGRVVRLTVRRAAKPRSSDLCLLPGSSVAKQCPADAG